MIDPQIAHCLEQLQRLVQVPIPDRRDILQLGYNLGRLSEQTALGREVFWDPWKAPVTAWDQSALIPLAQDLQACLHPTGARRPFGLSNTTNPPDPLP